MQKAFVLFVRLSDAGSLLVALFLLVKSVTSKQPRKKRCISSRKVSDRLKLRREAKSKPLTHVPSSLSQRDHFVTSGYFTFFQHPRYPRNLHNFHYRVFVSLCPEFAALATRISPNYASTPLSSFFN